jgi:hypothetical protein
MLDKRIVFGMHRFRDYEDKTYLPFITLTNLGIKDASTRAALGSPGIIDEQSYKSALEKIKASEEEPDPVRAMLSSSPVVRLFFPFPTRVGHYTGMRADARLNHIHVRKDVPSIIDTETIMGKEYDPKDIHNIAKHVDDKGALTFQFETEQLSEFTDNLIGATVFSKEYKTNILMGRNVNPYQKRKDGDVVIGLISFMRLDLCIPIFDFKHMDGMGVWTQVIAQGPSFPKVPNLFTLTTILTNNYKKLFEIDGENLAPSGTRSVSGKYLDELRMVVEQFDSKISNSGKKKSKKSLSFLEKYGISKDEIHDEARDDEKGGVVWSKNESKFIVPGNTQIKFSGTSSGTTASYSYTSSSTDDSSEY